MTANSRRAAKPMAIAYMAMASALHFAGYEVARSSTITLLTSQRNGFESGASIVSCAMGTMPLFSVLLLWCYTRLLDGWGPRVSLFISTICYSLLLALSGIFLRFLDAFLVVQNEEEEEESSLPPEQQHLAHLLSKATLFSLFVLENSYVQLLSTQHWSFITSVVQTFEKENEEIQKGQVQKGRQQCGVGSTATIWFGPIAGAGSLMSSAACFAIVPLVSTLGLPNLLVVASIGIAMACACSDVAYRIANKNGFAPAPRKASTSEAKEPTLQKQQKQPIHRRALSLFQRVPILGALCVEVVIYQCQSSLLSFVFVWSVRESIVNDEERARYNTLTYTWINLLSGILQFTILPLIVSRVDSPASKRPLWLIMPSLMALSSVWSVLTPTSLFPVTVSYCLAKALEYSIRGLLMEMVFVTLDYEAVFFGKEIIGLFANRLGKGVMAVVLAGVTSVFAKRHGMIDHLNKLIVVISFSWFYVSFRLTRLLKQHQQQQVESDEPLDKSFTD